MTKFLLIRHALTHAVGKRLSGRMPGVYLSEEGITQAENLALRLAHLPVRAIYSSPLERAVQTAVPIAEKFGLENKVNEDFLEVDFGEWTNKTFKEIETELQFQRFNSYRSVTRIPGGESMLEAQARFIKGLERLYILHPQQTVAIVSHSDLIKATMAYFAGVHLDMFQRIDISPASVSILEMYDETSRISLVNDTGRIEA